jgi:hypothetical protein
MIKFVLTCDVCQVDYPERFATDMAVRKVHRYVGADGWHTREIQDTRDKRDLCPECKRMAAAKALRSEAAQPPEPTS